MWIFRNRSGQTGTPTGLDRSRNDFFTYVRRTSDGAWIGTVSFRYNPQDDWWEMSIVLYAPYRGMGYAVPTLELMLHHAFDVCKISRIHNDFELSRKEESAWKTHFAVGFREISREDGWLTVMMTREQWLQEKVERNAEDAQRLYELAMKYIYGDGVPENNEYAVELLTQSHALGNL